MLLVAQPRCDVAVQLGQVVAVGGEQRARCQVGLQQQRQPETGVHGAFDQAFAAHLRLKSTPAVFTASITRGVRTATFTLGPKGSASRWS